VDPRDFDRTGFVACMKKFYGYVVAILQKKGLSGADADDLALETFEKALMWLRKGNSWPDAPEKVKALLARVATRVRIDFLRKQLGRGPKKRARMIPFSSLRKDRDFAAEVRCEPDAATEEEGRDALMELFALLEREGGPGLAEIARLVAEEATQEEIAVSLGVSLRTVQKRAQKIRQLLGPVWEARWPTRRDPVKTKRAQQEAPNGEPVLPDSQCDEQQVHVTSQEERIAQEDSQAMPACATQCVVGDGLGGMQVAVGEVNESATETAVT
jgi:RNA polymerase sigma factor (sigma-70 family)